MSSQKSMDAADAEDNSWVIDSLVQFLSGPVWNKPIAAFIEKKSTVFAPDCEDDSPEHRHIHQEYRNLVDSLLGAFVEELQISPIQFQNAVSNEETGQSALARFQPGALLEQVWAASDFQTFSRLMGLRNLELQLQALDSIRQQGNMPMTLEMFADNEGVAAEVSGEERLLKHVLRRSMEEASIMERMKKFNRLSLAEPIATELSFADKEDDKAAITKKNAGPALAELREVAQDKASLNTPAQKKVHPELDCQNLATNAVNKLTDEEIQKRKEYLCQQRDRLLQARGRNKQITVTTQDAERNDTVDKEQVTEQVADEALQLRRALVNRLKAEIINKN